MGDALSLVYVQFFTGQPADTTALQEASDLIMSISVDLVRDTIVPLQFVNIIHGVDSQCIVYKTHDLFNALAQLRYCLERLGLLEHCKLAFSSEVVTYTAPLTTDFSHIYFNVDAIKD